VYAVGERTAAECRTQLGLACRGEHAGRAAALAPTIVADHLGGAAARPVLFLAGDKAMPVLPTLLAEARVPLEQVCVYATQPRADLPALLDAYHTRHGLALRWVVVHSPSTVYATAPTLARWAQPQPPQHQQGIRLAAIGPTTAAALETVGLVASAVAAVPSPAGVAAAILAAACDAPSVPTV
jgi:uroporphyrinogen-III synthase